MKNKLILGLFALSLAGFGIGYILSDSYSFGLCYSSVGNNTFDVSCHSLHEAIGNPLYYGMGALTLIFLILMFVPLAFSAWKKFAIWFIPLAALLFAFYPNPGSGDFFSPYPEQVFQWVSAFYVLVSALIIAFVSLRNKTSISGVQR